MIELRTAKRFAALTLSVSALAITMGSAPATAQTTETGPTSSSAAAADATPQVQADGAPVAQAPGNDIVVTGSRIPQPNLTGISPVTVINSQEVGLQGTTRVEDLLNSLPQSFASQGGNIANGATGTATVNLRNLGSSRTLVLINGRRLLPGDPGSPVPDINFVPAQLIKRVDVLTGGASSVYGSDAVAGVVNFVLDTDFEGLKATAQYSFFDHVNHADDSVIGALNDRGFGYPDGHKADGGTIDASLTFGAAFGDNRGHVTAFAGYRKLNPITQGDRDYSACALGGGGMTDTGSISPFACGGSGTNATGRFFLQSPAASTGTYTVQGSSFVPYSGARDAFNYAPYNYFQRPDERYTFGAFADYEVSKEIHPYMEAMFMDDRTVAQIAPSGDFGNTLTLPCDNPLLSAQQVGLICTPANTAGQGTVTRADGTVVPLAAFQTYRRNIEGGGRRDDQQHTDYRIVAGLKGDLNDAFSYDAYYQYGRVVYAETYFNDFSVTRLGRALDVTSVAGVPTCASVVDGSDPGCVPYNIFTAGAVSSDALNYLQTPGFKRGNTQEQVFNASVTALLGQYGIKSPFANDGLGLNIGYEYRKETLTLNTDQAFTSGDLAGQGGPTIGVSGGFKVNEYFAEGRLPLIEDKPFFQSLTLEGGYRYSHYDNGVSQFNAESYKGAVDWQPFSSIRLRAGYNRAVRAPNAVESFAAQAVVLDGATDPCAGAVSAAGTVNGFTAAQCALTGVTAAQFGNIDKSPANQYNGLTGGNPNLTPEKADTYTAGVVFTPTFIRNFSLTADYFNIKVKNQIGIIGADQILLQCLNNGQLCGNIVRDQFGSLYRTPAGYVIDTNLNAGSLQTEGIDFGANYSREFGFGRVGIDSSTTYLMSFGADPGTGKYGCAGYYGTTCGTPAPKWRAKTRLSYTAPGGIGLSGQWRYFGPVNLDTTSPEVTDQTTPNNRIGAQSYFDLAGTFRVTDAFSLRIGVNNILDRDPPVVGGEFLTPVFGSGNTFPQVYDYAGRYIFSGVTLNF